MKKQYFKLKLKLVGVVVLCMLLGCMVLTYHKAIHIRGEYVKRVDEALNVAIDVYLSGEKTYSTSKNIHKAYSFFYNMSGMENVGFYGMVKDMEDSTLGESQYFVYVKMPKSEDDIRIIALDEDVFEKNEKFRKCFAKENFFIDFVYAAGDIINNGSTFSNIEIIGTCDDTYIYPKRITWVDSNKESYIYETKEDMTDLGDEAFEEWAGSNLYDAGLEYDNSFYVLHNSMTYAYDNVKSADRLNEEAKDKCNELYAKNTTGADSYIRKEGLFSCEFGGIARIVEDYSMPYYLVFHPVSIAMSQLAGIYAGATILGIMIITIIYLIVDSVYKQQFAYEMNRRELTRGIAHELKTPIAIVKGYMESWRYMSEEDKEANAKTMIDEMNHMDTMVMDLLELSRLEAKAKKMHIETVDIHMLTLSIFGRMKEIITDRKLEVTVTPRAGEILINADLEMMRTVLENFITNAVKYADSKIEINITEAGKKVRFAIINDGESIEAKKLLKVWDEFYRAGNTNDHRIGSSGLGLAITKNILILHEAKYGCESSKNRTMFWFEIKK